jgi:hypothetical protein
MKKGIAILSASGLLAVAGIASAADATKPAAPSLTDVLASSGITATGYVSGTYVYSNGDGFGHQFDNVHDSFQLNQAAITVAYQPKEGFGALVNVIGGKDANLLPPGGSDVVIPQAFVQYASGPVTLSAGRLLTLAGAEVIAPTGNTNITRSFLFVSEPLTHTGVRVAIAPSDTFGFTFGVNNGWNYTSLASSSAKTGEVGFSVTPSKAFSLAAQAYFGKDPTFDAQRQLFDLVATINATDNLSFVLSYDYGKQDEFTPTVDAKWQGIAAYVNVAFTDMVRLSVRAEYFKDDDGLFGAVDNKIKEATVTLGIAPAKSFELRIEGRYDKSDMDIFAGAMKDTQSEFALEGLYKF